MFCEKWKSCLVFLLVCCLFDRQVSAETLQECLNDSGDMYIAQYDTAKWRHDETLNRINANYDYAVDAEVLVMEAAVGVILAEVAFYAVGCAAAGPGFGACMLGVWETIIGPQLSAVGVVFIIAVGIIQECRDALILLEYYAFMQVMDDLVNDNGAREAFCYFKHPV